MYCRVPTPPAAISFLLLRRVHNTGDCGNEFGPLGMLVPKLLASYGSQFVEFRAPVLFGSLPVGGDPALQLQALQSRIERSEFDFERFVRPGVQGFGDSVAV